MNSPWTRLVKSRTARPIPSDFVDELRQHLRFEVPAALIRLWEEEALSLGSIPSAHEIVLYDEGLLAQMNLYESEDEDPSASVDLLCDDDTLYRHRGQLLVFGCGGGGEPVFIDGTGELGPPGAVYTDDAGGGGVLGDDEDRPEPERLAEDFDALGRLLITYAERGAVFHPLSHATDP